MSEQERERSVEARLEALERAVRELRAAVSGGAAPLRDEERPTAPPRDDARPTAPPATPRAAAPSRLEGGDPWRWLGIGLLLFGVAFLFKYSIDRGWLTPSVRVASGLVLAGVLLAISGRLPPARRTFGRILDGGAVATLYITGFAAFQLYALVPYAAAFAFLVAVTLLGFWLSARREDQALAVIATAGGLATPFLLYRGEGSVPGLVAYTVLLLAGSGGVYLRAGGAALLAVAMAGGALVFGLAIAQASSPEARPVADRNAIQLGLLAVALLFAVLPVVRARRGAEDAVREASVLAVSLPFAVLALSSTLWSWERETWGWIALAAAGFALGVAAALRGISLAVARAYGLSAALLVTLALALLLEGSWLVAALAAEALALHALVARERSLPLSVLAHLLSAAVVALVAERLVSDTPALRALATPQALTDLFAVLCVAAAAGFVGASLRGAYRAVALAGLLAWILRGLADTTNGQAWITAAWAAVGLALLVAGLRRDDGELRLGGRLVLFVVVAKLFLVDLAQVDTLWRIVSFLGLGAVFLALSYWLPALWRPAGAGAERTWTGGEIGPPPR